VYYTVTVRETFDPIAAKTRRQRAQIAVIIIVLFAAILVLRLSLADPQASVGLLYGLPVSIAALYFRTRIAVASAVLAVGLVGVAALDGKTEAWTLLLAAVFIPYALMANLVADRMRRVATTSHEAEVNLAELIETVRESYVRVDVRGRIVDLNEDAEELFGWARDEALGIHFADAMLAAEPADELRRNIALVLAGEPAPWFRQWHDEIEARRRNGDPLTVEFLVAPLREGSGWRFNIFIFDISERARTWQEHARMAAIVQFSADAIFSYNLHGKVTSWNYGAERLYGYTAEEMIGNSISMIVPPDRPTDIEWILSRIRNGNRIEDFETMRTTKRGRLVDVALTASPVRDQNGDIVEAALVARDVSERKRQDRYRQGQHSATRVLAEAADPAEVIGELLAILGDSVGWPCGAIWYRDGEDTRLRCVDIWTRPGVDSPSCPFERGTALDLDGPPPPELIWDHPADEGSPIPGATVTAEAGLQTVLWVPVTIEGTTLGAVELMTRRRLERDEPMIMMTSAVSSLLTELMRRRHAESEAERLKDEFFGMVSHEMRTPLTSIIGYAELLADFEGENLSEQGRGFLGVIERNARREMRLVGDLLALVRIEAGTFSVEPESIELTEVARQAADAAAPRAEQQKVTLTASLEPLGVNSGDPHRLGQVFDNLLSNAIKFTPDGGRVDLRVARQDGAAIVEVSDSGIGIPEAEQKRLFDRLYRASSATDRHIPGLGLGLTIVRAIVEAHGGTVSVESIEGEGTTFRVELPLRPPPSKPTSEPGAQPSTVEATL